VRELRNRVERAVALAQAPWISPDLLFPERSASGDTAETFSPLAEVREQIERQHIHNALERAQGRVEDAARLLGVSRSTLFDKMRRLKLDH
jgi:DNA-binding NtrC family response regulator